MFCICLVNFCRISTNNGHFVTVQTEWHLFTNKYSNTVELVEGTHRLYIIQERGMVEMLCARFKFRSSDYSKIFSSENIDEKKTKKKIFANPLVLQLEMAKKP